MSNSERTKRATRIIRRILQAARELHELESAILARPRPSPKKPQKDEVQK